MLSDRAYKYNVKNTSSVWLFKELLKAIDLYFRPVKVIFKEPNAKTWIKPFMVAYEFVNNKKRYCLWLKGITPMELNSMPLVLERIKKVKESRLNSPTPSVRELSKYPSVFTQDRHKGQSKEV